jgi:transcriptional regulator
MPCLLERDAAELTVVSHVARADPAADSLDGPLLLIFQGPHGYVSASWYDTDTIQACYAVT